MTPEEKTATVAISTRAVFTRESNRNSPRLFRCHGVSEPALEREGQVETDEKAKAELVRQATCVAEGARSETEGSGEEAKKPKSSVPSGRDVIVGASA